MSSTAQGRCLGNKRGYLGKSTIYRRGYAADLNNGESDGMVMAMEDLFREIYFTVTLGCLLEQNKYIFTLNKKIFICTNLIKKGYTKKINKSKLK